MRETLKLFTVAVVASLVTGSVLVGVQVYANDDDNPATDAVPRAFSYQGHLDWDGLPVNGNTLMTFALYGAPDAPTAKWSETQTVPVFNGRFGAELGANDANPIANTVYDAGPLYLGITVQRFDEDDNLVGEPVVLGNRQKINPVPYALWATQSTNLNVANDLGVGRNATIGGNATVTNDATVGRHLTVTRDALVQGNAAINGQLGVVGNGNSAAVTVANRVGNNAFDQFSDYQLLLFQGNAARTSYGVGIEPGTMAFNSDDDFVFYEEGTLRLHIDNNNLRFNGALIRPNGFYTQANNSGSAGNFSVRHDLPGPATHLCTLVGVRDLGSGAGGCTMEQYPDRHSLLAWGSSDCQALCWTWR